LLQFLSYNGYAFVMDQKQAEDFVVDVVNHKYTFEQVVRMIESHSHQQQRMT
jgi:death-on-curing protein